MAPSRAQEIPQDTEILVKERNTQNHATEKDATEEELERLIFGDSAGFRDGLRAFRETGELSKGKELVPAVDEVEVGESGLEGFADTDLFFLDDGPVGGPVAPRLDSDEESVDERDGPAWSDSDDEQITVSLASRNQLRKLRRTENDDLVTGKEYSKRLRKQFHLLNPVPQWVSTASKRPTKKRRTSTGSTASDSSGDEMDVDGDELAALPLARLLRDADALIRSTPHDGESRKRKLRPEVIDIQRMKDIVASGPSSITTLQIHPTLPLLLSSGGASSRITLHRLQPQPPTPNPLLTSVLIKKTPIHSALFHPSPTTSRIFLGSRRRYFHIWDLATGHFEKITRVLGHQDEQASMERFKISPDGAYIALQGTSRKGGGVLNILDAGTLQWVAQARVEGHGGVADFCWWADSAGLCIASKSGEITEWLLATRTAVARWKDEGAVGTTTIALGGSSGRPHLGTDRWIAVGSSAGIVNIYDRRAWGTDNVPGTPKPTRVLDQLVTPISHLVFSPCGQVLCMASMWKADAVRLVHLPNCAVYRNWPTGKTPLGRVSAVCMGEDEQGGLVLVVGNEKGAIRGWEIRG